jgi:hypothetical protein
MLNQGFAVLNAVVKSGSSFLAVFLIRLYFLLIWMRGSVTLNYWPEFGRLVYYGSDQTPIRLINYGSTGSGKLLFRNDVCLAPEKKTYVPLFWSLHVIEE